MGMADTQELRGVRAGLGDSWVRLVKESHEGPRGASERSGGLPEWRGGLGQLGFAVEGHRGTTIERRRRVDQNCKGCEAIPFRGLEGGTDEGITDQCGQVYDMI